MSVIYDIPYEEVKKLEFAETSDGEFFDEMDRLVGIKNDQESEKQKVDRVDDF